MTPKQILRSALSDPMQFLEAHKADCNLCGYHGRFWSFGRPARRFSRCPQCSSLERHRLYGLMLSQRPDAMDGKSVLHFAPEKQVQALFVKHRPREYITADIQPGVADRTEDMTALTLDNDRFDLAVANHVLEHIPADNKAFAEIFRVLKPGGEFWAAVPIVEGWEKTYENPDVNGESARTLHFGQHNHVRYYGRDFITRFEAAGFNVSRFQATPQHCVQMGLSFGETIFIGKKPL